MKMPGQQPTLKEFADKLPKKGNFRFVRLMNSDLRTKTNRNQF